MVLLRIRRLSTEKTDSFLLRTVLFLALSVSVLLSFVPEDAFAETEYFTVADNNYELKSISLKEGDEIKYAVTVSGGANDDVSFTIYYPEGGNDGGGRVYEIFSDGFVAESSGIHVFEFDNTFSLLSNKKVEFSYEITKNTYHVYVYDLPHYAEEYAGNAVYDTTEFWKDNLPKKQFYVAENEDDADIIVQWVRDFGSFNDHVGYSYIRIIEVGLGDSNCYDDWKEYNSDYLTNIMVHEVGHAIGFEHSDNPDAVMYPTINPNLERYSSPCVSPQSLERVAETPNSVTQASSQSVGGCLIATATYGTELAPQVQLLREIRDTKLLQTESGQLFMNSFNEFYYSFSPVIADFERENSIFREIVKIGITPMISSLSILNYVDTSSDQEVLGYGISLILLNVGMYVLAPVFLSIILARKLKLRNLR